MQDQQTRHSKLSELDDWKLHDSDQDIRGRRLMTASGTELGTIREMLVDTGRERVSAVVLDDGQSFPVETLEIREDSVITHEPGLERGPTVAVYEATLIRSNR